jgi:cytochrome c oxidase accessory protein FixG
MSIIDHTVEDHESFRSELASIALDGRRKWIYARQPSGRYYTWRTRLSWFLLAFLVFSPFIKVNGQQFMLLNVLERFFVILGVPFYPQDFYLVVLLFLTGLVSVVLFTATLGRIWCGWFCPQTIFLEMVFRRIEWLIDGPPKEQARRRGGPWNGDRLWRTVVKQGIFFAISFGIANVFLAYLISSDKLLGYITDGPQAHLSTLIPLVLFSIVFYLVFARFREQACVIVCPYGRYMSTLVDDNTVAVTYDFARGEQRGKMTKADKEAIAAGQSRPANGDCIDCYQCVTVCPTGIDIRNGIQLECVNCTACIDACDEVMTKIHRPVGLIRYSSAAAITQGQGSWLTTRVKAYMAVWLVLVSVVTTLFVLRSDVDVLILRQEGTLYATTEEGIVNFYRLQLINKTSEDLPVTITVTEPKGATLRLLEPVTELKAGVINKSRFMLTIPKDHVDGDLKATITVTSNGTVMKTVTTSFVGPTNDDDDDQGERK